MDIKETARKHAHAQRGDSCFYGQDGQGYVIRNDVHHWDCNELRDIIEEAIKDFVANATLKAIMDFVDSETAMTDDFKTNSGAGGDFTMKGDLWFGLPGEHIDFSKEKNRRKFIPRRRFWRLRRLLRRLRCLFGLKE